LNVAEFDNGAATPTVQYVRGSVMAGELAAYSIHFAGATRTSIVEP
jgi:hypothetical protein